MATLPDDMQRCVAFLSARIEQWQADPSAIGLSEASVSQLAGFIAVARERLAEADAARASSMAATTALHTAIDQMRGLAGPMISAVRAFALTADDPGVYARAQIDPPQPSTPARPPTAPTNIRAVIEPTGAVTLRFRPSTPAPSGSGLDPSTRSVVFTIKRQLPGERGFTIIGAVPAARGGHRALTSFTDHTLPGGGAASGVRYVIQGQRASATGTSLLGPESAVYTLLLGTAADEAAATPADSGVRLMRAAA